MTTEEDIHEILNAECGVDEYFYPGISMEIDTPYGLGGEVKAIMEWLVRRGFEANAKNVFHFMQMKRKLLEGYRSSNEGKAALRGYSEIVFEHVKPVGAAVPSDLLFVNAIVVLLLYLAGKFLGSFMSEAGKIAAKRIMAEDEEEVSEELKADKVEYDFFRKEVIELLGDKAKIEILVEDIEEIKKRKIS